MPLSEALRQPHLAIEPWTSSPSGDGCLLLEFARTLSLAANRRAAACARRLERACRDGALPGVYDIVPGMVTVAVHYRPEHVEPLAGERSPYEALLRQAKEVLAESDEQGADDSKRIEIPVRYGGEHGPDLDDVAARLGLTPAQLVELHASQWLDVLMVGFAPGHPYIGVLDPRLDPGRRPVPRTRVAPGSIGLANRQSVIYPLELPGGWHLIGRTPLVMFDSQRQSPCLLRAGDSVRFVPIGADAFVSLARRR